MKRVTLITKWKTEVSNISIHTLCEEGDIKMKKTLVFNGYISIHTLCEEGDTGTPERGGVCIIFQSTPSVKRVTLLRAADLLTGKFQSTPSVKRVTLLICMPFQAFLYFNPHPLWRGWRKMANSNLKKIAISIHTLCEEGDLTPRL